MSVRRVASVVVVQAKWDFEGDAAKKQLTFKKNQLIRVLRKKATGWGFGKLLPEQKQVGWFPLNYVQDVLEVPLSDSSGVIKSLAPRSPAMPPLPPLSDSGSVLSETPVPGDTSDDSASSGGGGGSAVQHQTMEEKERKAEERAVADALLQQTPEMPRRSPPAPPPLPQELSMDESESGVSDSSDSDEQEEAVAALPALPPIGKMPQKRSSVPSFPPSAPPTAVKTKLKLKVKRRAKGKAPHTPHAPPRTKGATPAKKMRMKMKRKSKAKLKMKSKSKAKAKFKVKTRPHRAQGPPPRGSSEPSMMRAAALKPKPASTNSSPKVRRMPGLHSPESQSMPDFGGKLLPPRPGAASFERHSPRAEQRRGSAPSQDLALSVNSALSDSERRGGAVVALPAHNKKSSLAKVKRRGHHRAKSAVDSSFARDHLKALDGILAQAPTANKMVKESLKKSLKEREKERKEREKREKKERAKQSKEREKAKAKEKEKEKAVEEAAQQEEERKRSINIPIERSDSDKVRYPPSVLFSADEEGAPDSALELEKARVEAFWKSVATKFDEWDTASTYSAWGDRSLLAETSVFRCEFGEEGVPHPSKGQTLTLLDSSSQTLFYASHLLSQQHFHVVGNVTERKIPVIVTCEEGEEGKERLWMLMVRMPRGYVRAVEVAKKSAKAVQHALNAIFGSGAVNAKKEMAHVAVGHPIFDKLCEDLFKYEKSLVVTSYKVGVLRWCAGQSEDEAFSNDTSADFEEFLNLIGKRIRLKGWSRFRGGLNVTDDSTGEHSVFAEFQQFEIMFHVSTLLPFHAEDAQKLERKRHLGNDIVMIIFWEGEGRFDPAQLHSQFNHVFIVVQKDAQKTKETGTVHYRMEVATKPDVPRFKPYLPRPPLFPATPEFVEYFLLKVVNAERSAMRAKDFRGKMNNTRKAYLNSMVDMVLENGK